MQGFVSKRSRTKVNYRLKSGYKRVECHTSLHDLLKIVKILNLQSDCN
jgi:hypothetical protein